VLLDMHMPEMDGEATAAAIRAEPRLAGIPLVLFSSISSRKGRAGASRDHFAAVLTKPVRSAHLLAVVSAVARGARGAAPSGARGPDARRRLGLRVLLAEDNAVNSHVAIQMLGRLGCEVTAVEDGTQVLAALQAEVYDVVLMDVQMPVMDGFETTVNVRRSEADTGRHVPIIAMTAHAREGDRERCLAVGMDGYVAKPVRTAELLAALAPYARRGEPVGHGGGDGASRSIVSTTSSSPSSSSPASTRRTTPSRSTT
jgi:two-component system sensor histidine kinase/response regulator